MIYIILSWGRHLNRVNTVGELSTSFNFELTRNVAAFRRKIVWVSWAKCRRTFVWRWSNAVGKIRREHFIFIGKLRRNSYSLFLYSRPMIGHPVSERLKLLLASEWAGQWLSQYAYVSYSVPFHSRRFHDEVETWAWTYKIELNMMFSFVWNKQLSLVLGSAPIQNCFEKWRQQIRILPHFQMH